MTDLGTLSQRLLDHAEAPILSELIRNDLQAAADVVRDYEALMRVSRKGPARRDYGLELARLLCSGGLLERVT